MHHCGNALYLQDKFCSQCGEGIKESRKLITLTDLEPNLLDDLTQSCPEASTFTCRLKSSVHYKRHHRSGNNSVTYSYWWITLESAEGELKQISINAENKAFNSLKVGDVITLLEPTGITLTYKLDSAAKGIVTNNQLAGGVILHNDDGQVSTLTNHYNCSHPSLPSFIVMGLVLACVAALIIYCNSNLGDGAMLAGIFVSIACMVPWYNSSVSSYKLNALRKERIKAVVARILEINKFQLGFHRVERPNLADDIFCGGCEQRIQADINFCPHCGYNQFAPQNLLPEPELELEFGGLVAMDAQSETQLQPCDAEVQPQGRKSIREMRLDKMKEYFLRHKQEYVYSHVLSPDEKFNGHSWCYMVQVTDRNMNTNVSDVTHTETTRTDYTNRYGRVVDSKYETTTYRIRSSNLSGKITVEDELGEVFEQWLPESLMSHTDVGDYLLIGYSKIENEQSKYSYGEYYYNVSKGRWNMPESVHSYGQISLLSKLLVFLAALGSGLLAYYSQSLELGGCAFGAFMAWVIVKSWLNAKAANNNAGELIKPIMDMVDKVKADKQELLAYLAKLK